MTDTDLSNRLAEPYAFALVTWPAVLGLLTPLPEAWATWAQAGLAVWLAAMQLGAYARGVGFGNVMLFLSGTVALAAYGHPSPWSLAALPVLLVGLHAAQRARLDRAPEATA
ncbi:hypothetical protein EZJ19_12390 [Parasulfuritortus cantonensis]|uniref:Uncharacterized protein n=1 Tax=Parasulfuritortus cantonensis TaxID=2528202 RepID=A0A4R1B8I4_9PROT|nr:hypothetical protein [Parasulfuritortus cantonensis]TCJ12329.1 hypothetical protein EZJ19_12390 [Parasulfuritortus cantonensis]